MWIKECGEKEVIEKSYVKTLTENVLILEDQSGYGFEDYRVRMLTRNKLSTILPCQVRMLNGVLKYQYDLTGTRSLSEEYAAHPMKKEDIKRLIRGIERATSQMEEFFLESSGILLEPETIYINAFGEYRFCYYPGRKIEFRSLAEPMADFLLDHLDYEDKEGVYLGYNIYKASREENAGIHTLLNLTNRTSISEAEVYHDVVEEKIVFESNPVIAAEQEPKPEIAEKEERKKNTSIFKRKKKLFTAVAAVCLLFVGTGIYAITTRNKNLSEINAYPALISEDSIMIPAALLGAFMLFIVVAIFTFLWYKRRKSGKSLEKQRENRKIKNNQKV